MFGLVSSAEYYKKYQTNSKPEKISSSITCARLRGLQTKPHSCQLKQFSICKIQRSLSYFFHLTIFQASPKPNLLQHWSWHSYWRGWLKGLRLLLDRLWHLALWHRPQLLEVRIPFARYCHQSHPKGRTPK